MKSIKKTVNSSQEMQNLGCEIAKKVNGGDVIELIGDVGAGKTTFTKGFAQELGISETVQSPSFTISRFYEGDDLSLTHYDFYRLNDAGIMKMEIAESISNPDNITIIEWAESVLDVLDENRIKINIEITGETQRRVKIEGLK